MLLALGSLFEVDKGSRVDEQKLKVELIKEIEKRESETKSDRNYYSIGNFYLCKENKKEWYCVQEWMMYVYKDSANFTVLSGPEQEI